VSLDNDAIHNVDKALEGVFGEEIPEIHVDAATAFHDIEHVLEDVFRAPKRKPGSGWYVAPRPRREAPPGPPPELPERAILAGPHGQGCCFQSVHAPDRLDVARLPKGFKLCTEHWERVKEAQGGAFKRFDKAGEELYVGDRYVNQWPR
jgi:hypothetical protein